MILQRLPDPGLYSNTNTVPVFADHCLFTEKLSQPYEYPEHFAGLGIITGFRGSGQYYINGNKNTIAHSQYMIVNTGSQLAIRIKEKESQPGLLFFHTRLLEAVAHSLVLNDAELLDHQTPVNSTDCSLLERTHGENHLLHKRLQQIIDLGNSCASFYAMKADSIARAILQDLLLQNKDALKLSHRLEAIKKSTRTELYKRLSIAREWMEAHCTEPVSLVDIARQANLNSQHFLRSFKQLYRQTPHQHLLMLRLNRVKQLLKDSGMPVNHIAHQCGFDSIPSFTLLFRQRFGCSPTQFRNQQE